MEKQKEISGILELVPQGAFVVNRNTVQLVNQAARQLLIEPGTPVETLLKQNMDEYATFDGGCLCLTLTISGCPVQACVTRMDAMDLFVIDGPEEQAELKAMALTAMSLREPLSDLIASKTHLLTTIDRDSKPSTQTWIGQLNRSINQMHRMICNMTNASQYACDTAPRMVYQDICSVVSEIFAQAAVHIERAGFRLNYTGPNQAIPCMIAPDRLERAIYNILSNALKTAPAGSTIDAVLTRRHNKLYLSIQDEGPGIPEHLMGNLYWRYRRQPAIESQPAGMGLGMVLVRGTAAAHGGAVLIDQPKGKGTRITMSISIFGADRSLLRSTVSPVDYAGEFDHALLELSDVLPAEFYI